jgi:hypothetical protein
MGLDELDTDRCRSVYARLALALRVPLHDANAVADHEPAGGLLRDCSTEYDAGQGERVADRQRLLADAPLLLSRLV